MHIVGCTEVVAVVAVTVVTVVTVIAVAVVVVVVEVAGNGLEGGKARIEWQLGRLYIFGDC